MEPQTLADERDTPDQSSAQGQFVSVLQLVVLCNASRYDGDINAEMLQFPIDKVVCCVALHRWAQSQYDLLHPSLLDALHEAIYLEIGRTYSIHRADGPPKNMVEASVLHGIFNGHDVLHILHHTDYGVIARRITANVAAITIADVVAHLAVVHATAHVQKAFRQRLHCAFLFTQQVQGKPKGCLTSDARQAMDFSHRLLKVLGREVCFHPHSQNSLAGRKMEM